MKRRIMLLIIVSLAACQRTAPPATPPVPVAVASDELQTKRYKFIMDCKEKRILHKLDVGERPELHVLPKFHELTFGDKQLLLEVCAGLAFQIPQDGSLRQGQQVRVIDARTNNAIGRFTSAGLTLD